MVDYYSVLLRAVTALGAGDANWRRVIYDRSRKMLVSRLRALASPPSAAEIAAEQAALDAAIERIEAELEWTEHGTGAPASRTDDLNSDIPGDQWIEPDSGALVSQSRLSRTAWIAFAMTAAALGALGYIFLAGPAQKSAPPAVVSHAPSPQPARAAANGELAPGIDGGSNDVDMAYVFRRQPTFYRTLQPVGTIIVDKLQHYLYLIQPNNVALRYGIAVGAQCADLAGLQHIASMMEWPPWQPPPGMLNRDRGAMPGGPGNPLGARLLQLDDDKSRIHGTNAPKTIGNAVAFGCIRLVNDDIVDLYGRVQVSTPVIVN
jgi:lipoprotein-anchoring transpeptidase ErfK/SrfK